MTFKLQVEAAGHQWPEDYVPGVGWKHEVESAEQDTPVLFRDHAAAYRELMVRYLDRHQRHHSPS